MIDPLTKEVVTPKHDIVVGEDPTATQILESFATAIEKRRAQGKQVIVTQAPYATELVEFKGGPFPRGGRFEGGNIKARVLINGEDWRAIYRGWSWNFERVK